MQPHQRPSRILLLFVAFCCANLLVNQADGQTVPMTSTASVQPPAKNLFHIYILMGQSNMAGRGPITPWSQETNPQILVMTPDGHWVLARDPLHEQAGRTQPGVGPGHSFAQAMLQADPTATIGLVPCAVGGSPLRRWVKGGDLYQHALEQARLAEKSGILSGMLWHQGESDAVSRKNAETYEPRLAGMIRDFRQDIGQPSLPVVVGQLGGFLNPQKEPFAYLVRAALRRIPEEVPRVGLADSAGLTDKGDHLHFNSDSQREFGSRYASVMLRLQVDGLMDTAALTVDLWPTGKMPGHGADAPEMLRTPERTDARRITNVSCPTLSLYPAQEENAPLMIVCPGGGYNYVVFDKEGSDIAAWLNSNGISAAVLKYRTPHNRDGAFQDTQRAISLARSRAAAWKIDPKRIGIIGFSAGGNLAAKASSLFDSRDYAPVDGIDELGCRPDFVVLVYPAYLEDRNGHLSPDLNLKAKIPPTLIVHNEDDKTFVNGSKLYHAALDEAGVPNEFKLYTTGGHGYGLRCTGTAKAWPGDALDWMRRNGLL